MEAFKYVMIGMAPGLTEAYVEMILASGDVGNGALMKLCHRILDGKRNTQRLGYQCCDSNFFKEKELLCTMACIGCENTKTCNEKF